MKKLVFIIFLLLSGLHSYAQKSYIYIISGTTYGASLFGDVPSEIDLDNEDMWFYNILSILSAYGFSVEEMSSAVYADRIGNISFLLSKSNDQLPETKSYILLVDGYSSHKMDLYGNLPDELKGHYSTTYMPGDLNAGDVMNILVDKGYSVEKFCGNHLFNSFLFSKTSSGNGSSVRGVKTDNNEVTEKARYNLKGNPVSTSYKGTQIIVYSDYSTKVVNVK